MVQPGVRRRRVIDSSSDDEVRAGTKRKLQKTSQGKEPSLQQLRNLPSRNRLRSPTPILSRATTSTPTSTPEENPKKKQTKPVQRDVGKKTNHKTIYSFFNNATQKLQQQARVKESLDADADESFGDAIQDDFSDADARTGHPGRQSISNLPNTKKCSFGSVEPSVAAHSESIIPSQSHKFYKTSYASRVGIKEPHKVESVSHELRPWPEEYSPASVEELVVHKKKVSDVRQWLSAALAGEKYKKLLVLKGPAGSGKTITFQLLAKSLGAQVTEWRNPSSFESSQDDYVSISGQFEDFLGRGKQFGSLDLGMSDEVSQNYITQNNPDQKTNNKHIILVEEIPYTLLRASAALQSFRSTLLQFLAVSTALGTDDNMTPIVFILSESDMSRNANIYDNLTAYRLLGLDILHHPSTFLVEFNAVAPTFITKALNLVLQKHQQQTGKRLAPSSDIIKKIAEIGDVRNAVSTLEFISTRSDAITSGSLIQMKSRSRTSKARVMPQSSMQPPHVIDLSFIGLRESTIGLFHAIGKVVYNKRSADIGSTSSDFSGTSGELLLPTHSSHLSGQLRSDVDVATLMDETGTDTSTFLSGLQENCTLSCYDLNGDTEATINTLNHCLDALGDADILMNSALSSRNGTSEGLRQEEIAFETGVRGLLFNLPNPVKRHPYPGKSKLDSYRMFYPIGLRIWKKQEELLGMVDYLIGRATAGTLLTKPHPYRLFNKISSTGLPERMVGITNGMAKAGIDGRGRNSEESNITPTRFDESKSGPHLALGSGHSARHEMLLERLPYIHRITTGMSQHSTYDLQKQIEQVTRFTGVGTLDEDDDTSSAMDVRFDSIVKGGTAHFHAYSKHQDEELDVRGLVLSDDDIEDD